MVLTERKNGLEFRVEQDGYLNADAYIIEMMEVVLLKLICQVNKRGCGRLSMSCNGLDITLGVEHDEKDEWCLRFYGDKKYWKHFQVALSEVSKTARLGNLTCSYNKVVV